MPLAARRRARALCAVPPAGQAMVEFAPVLLPILLLIVVAIVQFGLLFGANVTLTNAAREGARAGTIYVYDYTHTGTGTTPQRCGDDADAAIRSSMGFLSTSVAAFRRHACRRGACPTPSR